LKFQDKHINNLFGITSAIFLMKVYASGYFRVAKSLPSVKVLFATTYEDG